MASHTPSGPNLLGENITLSSPPLEPRRLLLSAMRQKVSKDRSQGVFAPLANPHRFLACPLRKFGPSPIPLEAMQNPDWRAQRHRRGRVILRIATNSENVLRPKLGQDLPMAGRSPRLRRPATYIASAMIAAPAGSGPKNNQLPFSAQCRLEETGGRRHPRRRDATFATLTCAAAGVDRETVQPNATALKAPSLFSPRYKPRP